MNGTLSTKNKVNHLLFMDDLELFGKSIDQIIHLCMHFMCSARISGWSLD